MSYFGGTAAERPWPKIDRTAVLLLSVFIVGITAYVVLATNAFQPPPPPPEQIVIIKEVPAPPKETTADVFVVVDAIWPGQRILPTMLRTENRSIVGMEDKVFRDANELKGAYASTSIVPNAPLLREHISFSPPPNILTARIPEGSRAVSIPVDAESGVEGWARPGSRVDVVWTSQNRGKMIVSTIVENAQVLSAERSIETIPQNNPASGPIPRFVTLLVLLKDAQKIQLAKASGSLSLNLRGDSDITQSGAGTLSVDNLLRRKDLEAMDEVEGKVRMNGKDFVMRGRQLVAAELAQE